jgi:hypothetical protein
MAYSSPYYTNRPKPDTSYFYGDQAAMQQRMNQQVAMPNVPPTTPQQGGAEGGANWGAIAGAATTGLSLIGNSIGMGNQSLGIDTQAPGLQTSATGEPVYNLGAFENQVASAKPQGVTGGEVLGAVGQGAAAGSAFGPVGTAVGAGVGLVTSLFGGRRRKRKQREEKQRALKSASRAKQNYNVASEAFDEQQTAQADYLRRMDMTNRVYNLYS